MRSVTETREALHEAGKAIFFLVLAIFIFALMGCAPTLRGGIRATEKAAKVLDVSVDLAATTWTAGLEERLAECRSRDLPTPEARRECLGPYAEGDRIVPALKDASMGYDLIVEGLEILRQAEKELRKLEKQR